MYGKPTHDSVLAKVARASAPGWGFCGRCGVPGKYTEDHITNYTKSRGCFPLCEDCWSIMSPEERLPYYRDLWEFWESHGGGYSDWDDIERAVLSGL